VGARRSLFRESYTREARFLTRWDQHALAQRHLNQSADETSTPASPCLPAVPLPRLHSYLGTASANYPPPLERRGGLSGQVTVDRLERLSRVLGHYSEVGLGAR
jgi:hypothetical protein